MNRPVRTTLLASVLGWAVLWEPTVSAAPLDDAGVGKATEKSADVSLKVVDSGQSNLFVKQFVIPPQGRPEGLA